MRILQIRFKNLNSLVGEWEIDLTHPAYASDGIFAITGPTGAGKSTILDAVCLALYGQTPRLGKITKGGNEIMSRRTGDCFAEVTFETPSGRYRCHWGQNTARKKPGAELQNPRHEITNADSGMVFESKIRGVADKIEEVTGMDFKRFTRSMLLAQGGFAAFLQAAPDDRAPILEQITGTEIYSLISMGVHARNADEKRKLETLEAEISGMRPLAAEDELQLGISLDRMAVRDAELNLQMARMNQSVAWIDAVSRLDEELVQLKRQKDEWQIRLDAFAPEQEKLRLAARALELQGEYASLAAIRREQEDDLRMRDECVVILPQLEKAAAMSAASLGLRAGKLHALREQQQQMLPVLRKVRELDLKAKEKDVPIREAGAAIAELSGSLETLSAKNSRDAADLEGLRSMLAALDGELDDAKADESLVEHLAGIRERIDALGVLRRLSAARHGEIKQSQEQVLATAHAWRNRADIQEELKRGLDGNRDALKQKQIEMDGILGDADLSRWRGRLTALTFRQATIGRAIETEASLLKSGMALDEIGRRRDMLMIENKGLETQVHEFLRQEETLVKELDLLETQLSLLIKIEDLTETRHQLQDGKPCPLCGSREHPFAEGGIPAPDLTRQQVGAARIRLKDLKDSISDLNIRQARVEKDIEQAEAALEDHAGKIAREEALMVSIRDMLRPGGPGMDPDAPGSGLVMAHAGMEWDASFEAMQKADKAWMDEADRVVRTAEALEKECGRLRNLVEKAGDAHAGAERDTQAARFGNDAAIMLLDRQKNELETIRIRIEDSLSVLGNDLADYGFETVATQDMGRIQEQLSARRGRWISRQEEKQVLIRKTAELGIRVSHQAEQILKADDEVRKQRNLQCELQGFQDALVRERGELLGDENPDDVELVLSKGIEGAGAALEEIRLEHGASLLELDTLKARMDALSKSLLARGVRMNAAEDAFRGRLSHSDFADEERFIAACLPEEKRKSLMETAKALSDENAGLSSKLADTEKRRESEHMKNMTDMPRSELIQAEADLAESRKTLQQEIGAMRQKLTDNAVVKDRLRERASAIDAQKRECSRWELLHGLIGSADGKKYRNFAQGLTFDIMISHANLQLRNLSDRYLLVRDPAQPLELCVIDNYQAGETRSTKNLSGGESFIVSLSLALGLSRMASRKVRVDSLFLDEGFGTLDEEALGTALETLAGLRQDGKLIGVISHVSALKERIGTQIRVMPQSGGNSILSGPGCARGKNAGKAGKDLEE